MKHQFVMGGRRWGAAGFRGLIAIHNLRHFPERLSHLFLSCFRGMDPKGLPLNVSSWETIGQFSWMLTGMDIDTTLSLRF